MGSGEEVPEPIGFEAQPEPFDRVEVRRIAGQELWFEMMPVEPGGFVPGGIVQNEQLANAFFFWNRFGHFIQKELKHIGIHTIDDKAEQSAALGRYGPNDILADMISQVRH